MLTQQIFSQANYYSIFIISIMPNLVLKLNIFEYIYVNFDFSIFIEMYSSAFDYSGMTSNSNNYFMSLTTGLTIAINLLRLLTNKLKP